MEYIHEIANSHQGSVEHGKKLISQLPPGYIKFQYRDLSILHPEHKTKHDKRFRETYLTDEQRLELVEFSRDRGVVITPFDEISVEMAARHGADILKVASCSADDWPLLEAISETGLPVIASTGGKTIEEVDRLYYFLKHRNVDFKLMHCVGIYPTEKNEDFNLGRITKFRERYDVPIGYSGHEKADQYFVGPMAIAAGAEILERHVALPPCNNYSMTPEHALEWYLQCQEAVNRAGFTDSPKFVEVNSMMELARGSWDGQLMMPRKAGDKYAPLPQKPTDVQRLRDYVHAFEGMFREAKIPLSGERHLSHHFGMENFSDTGAFIVDVVNREYCKKYVALLGGQAHPPHLHKKKEEVFQLLHGDLRVVLDGVAHDLEVGSTLLVPPGTTHSFTSVGGAIFEEISSRHYRDDSYYDDPRIADPAFRKTVL